MTLALTSSQYAELNPLRPQVTGFPAAYQHVAAPNSAHIRLRIYFWSPGSAGIIPRNAPNAPRGLTRRPWENFWCPLGSQFGFLETRAFTPQADQRARYLAGSFRL